MTDICIDYIDGHVPIQLEKPKSKYLTLGRTTLLSKVDYKGYMEDIVVRARGGHNHRLALQVQKLIHLDALGKHRDRKLKNNIQERFRHKEGKVGSKRVWDNGMTEYVYLGQ